MAAQPELVHDHMECIISDGGRVPLEMLLNLIKDNPKRKFLIIIVYTQNTKKVGHIDGGIVKIWQ